MSGRTRSSCSTDCAIRHPRLRWVFFSTMSVSPPPFVWPIAFDSMATWKWGSQIARQILTRLRFSNEDMRQVEALVANHMKFKDAPRMKESTLKRFLRLPAFDEHLELHRLDCSSSHNMLDNYHFVQEKRTEFGQEQIAPPPMLTGKDLIAAGYKPGPWFSRVLSAVEDAQLEGRISNKGQALALAASMSERASEPAST